MHCDPEDDLENVDNWADWIGEYTDEWPHDPYDEWNDDEQSLAWD